MALNGDPDLGRMVGQATLVGRTEPEFTFLVTPDGVKHPCVLSTVALMSDETYNKIADKVVEKLLTVLVPHPVPKVDPFEE